MAPKGKLCESRWLKRFLRSFPMRVTVCEYIGRCVTARPLGFLFTERRFC
ncbi:hypothetical protein PCH70_50950 [Pseudomonas cichorii JBC1]|nr:hypothetical protein PCH70_50950 [Pseudomonas cichorii JBC1]